MQHLPPYHAYHKGLNWNQYFTHCRDADTDALFPEPPVTPTSPESLNKLRQSKQFDHNAAVAEERRLDKLLLKK